ncbi:hypothetical protein [Bradyrhizobium sp.]|jgi:hypothetical protein|uniref:hypothetical protein n=1 Tax=Bradyrhizobium sp. TaxID=376 RepID=UPI002C9FE777|nr:hypothetical protein [Bradyrhizobium sp.]HWX58645.1 hypothetical protein [Bradyrhizobium sp.]
MVGLGVGVGEAVGVGVGVGDDVCARATCMVIARTKNSKTAAATGCPSPYIPLFSGFIDLDPRRMNPASKKEKNPGYGKSKTPGACPHSEHRAPQPQNLFADFGMSWARAICFRFRSEVPAEIIAASASGTSDRRHQAKKPAIGVDLPAVWTRGQRVTGPKAD